ncbi:Mitochondrial division protein 1 OS=Ustilago maydis (strain 521 / FGSC 9021) GN=MDV1 PE=3 SV=1 [Rhizoctonia solani AG-1 IB]|uniref:Mitochondrial division protein 1 n=1 Tax=Thanatephorus cucumeris (strain AG1-IB / isolate 7/3/14) TaxID=1108050 RepID=A0A0B7F5A9_THACB|nr:Mitochondrial division protein 1 OS=Ustilago maydis (strain 521 / FGSC 9021) GN=MDV1 PE=3 SV=1 [Rhizoctonia solani AG-1 IB]
MSTDARSRLGTATSALLAPFSSEDGAQASNRILSGLAPSMMTPRRMAAAASAAATGSIENPPSSVLDFATIGRVPLRISLGRRSTARDLSIREATDALLLEPIPDTPATETDSSVSFMRGFSATVNSVDASRSRRRKARNVDIPHLGLRSKALAARGMLTEGDPEESPAAKKSGRHRQSLSSSVKFTPEELARQKHEIIQDRENIHVRRSLINNEIAEITAKIAALDVIRNNLEQDLLRLHENELELEDELSAVQELQYLEGSVTPSDVGTSRRRKGPAFLPSEHDDLPPNIAFMTLTTSGPIAALDFSEPYGLLVTASFFPQPPAHSSNAFPFLSPTTSQSSTHVAPSDPDPRMWDLCAGTPIGRLRGAGVVRALQVQGQACVTGGADGVVRVWDLSKVPDDDESAGSFVGNGKNGKSREEEDFVHLERESTSEESGEGPETGCVKVLEGHSKAVTSLYFEDACMVTGAADKTIRQWDVTTGQCVLTMDILWAMSHPGDSSEHVDQPYDFSANFPEGEDRFVGGLQFWGYALVSGSADGAVRMWDMRTGQSHRTLLGHTAPITAIQFDEIHVVSSARDGTVRLWDLRSGGRTVELLRFGSSRLAAGNEFGLSAGLSEYSSHVGRGSSTSLAAMGGTASPVVGSGVGDVQFDSRKIVAASDNGVEIFNRISQQYTTLTVGGHQGAAERLRYIDRYLVSGGRDATVKIWAL